MTRQPKTEFTVTVRRHNVIVNMQHVDNRAAAEKLAAELEATDGNEVTIEETTEHISLAEITRELVEDEVAHRKV